MNDFLRRAAAALLVVTVLPFAVPAVPALANGAASTRNIIIGGAAAALLIINHNKRVHERYAEAARRQAQVEQDAHNEWVAYQDEKAAYQQEVSLNQSLQHEVALQHSMIVAQRRQISQQQHRIATLGSQQRVANQPPAQPQSVAQTDSGPFMQQTTLTRSARVETTRRLHNGSLHNGALHSGPPQRIVAQAFGWGTF